MVTCDCETWACEELVASLLGNGHHPKCASYARGPVKLFQINDCDWVMAPTLEEAIAEAMKLTGLDREEAIDDPHEVPDPELWKLQFVDGDDKRSFAEEMARRIADGKTVEFFASTEY